MKPRLAPVPQVSAVPGAIAVTIGARYLVELRAPNGSLQRRVARQYENVAATPAIRDSILDEMEHVPNALPREALELVSLVAAEGICGLEVVEVSPPYDCSDITALLATRVIVDVLGTLVSHGKMGSHKGIIDKPVSIPAGPDVE